MVDNKVVIQKFYEAFSNGNAEEMKKCYDVNAEFEDPAFGKLKGEDVWKMWEMLLSKVDSQPHIDFFNINADNDKGSAQWIATYYYGPKKRKVVNHISSSFQFVNGKIAKQKDVFDLWKWSRQALGLSGYLLGWTGYMKRKINTTTKRLLSKYKKV